MSDETRTYKILSIDGGGIRGVFPAAFLAKLEDHLSSPIGSYFDLIAGTSTGGIIAIALGLGLSAKDILKLYAERGSAIFDQQHGLVGNFVRQRLRELDRHRGPAERRAAAHRPADDRQRDERAVAARPDDHGRQQHRIAARPFAGGPDAGRHARLLFAGQPRPH